MIRLSVQLLLILHVIDNQWAKKSKITSLTCEMWGLERVNREVKRRTRVAVLFPNAESALRLVTGVLIEIHEDWVTGKQYLNMSL